LGLGKVMFSCLAKIAVERGCERLDWWCLNWNEPSIYFYKGMGAVPMSDWTVYRLEGERLRKMADLL
ncbi:MAG TPA: GNAT family N-acetyltransferase, partial [Methanomassiliicoccales archaeon]|nr:GNAT family N-acetyltransferase [Methanomassiliicoccales archaeon]